MTNEFRPGRDARRHRLATRHGRRAATTSAPLAVRRLLVLTLAAVLIAISFGLRTLVIDGFAADSVLAATEPRSTGTITAEHYQGRGNWDYDVTANGSTHWLDYYWHIPGGPHVGATVEIVVDPFDTRRALAVGEPEDWVADPLEPNLALVLALGFSGFACARAAKRWLPEDVERILDFGKPDPQL